MSEKYQKPPWILKYILTFISQPEERFSVIGDFEEIYNDHIEKKGIFTAYRWYSWQIVKSLPIGLGHRVI